MDGGFWPILNVRHLNHTFMKRSSRMTRLKQILVQIHSGDFHWFFSLDAYFLAHCTFTKCMVVALSPLRQTVICILNNINIWLVLAQLEVELVSHRTLLLSHVECLGLRVNFVKSMLFPSQ